MQINVSNLSSKDKAAIAKLTFPTKKETAENAEQSFFDKETNSYRVFNPDVPWDIQKEVLKIIDSKLCGFCDGLAAVTVDDEDQEVPACIDCANIYYYE